MKSHLATGISVILMLSLSPAGAQTMERQEDYHLAQSLAAKGTTDVAGFIMPLDVSRLVGTGSANDQAALKKAIETGRAKMLYHEVSTKAEGEAGRTGDFKQRFYSAVDKKGHETGMGAEIRPLGLVANWKREGVGIHVDVLYAEEGPLTKVGSMKMPSYRHSDISGTSVRLFDRPAVYRFSLPKGSKAGENNVAVIVVSPQQTEPLHALTNGTFVGQYIRGSSADSRKQ